VARADFVHQLHTADAGQFVICDEHIDLVAGRFKHRLLPRLSFIDLNILVLERIQRGTQKTKDIPLIIHKQNVANHNDLLSFAAKPAKKEIELFLKIRPIHKI